MKKSRLVKMDLWKPRRSKTEYLKMPKGSRQRSRKVLKRFYTGWEETFSHTIVPKDSQLIQKVGLRQGQKIQYFASFVGDWAKALAEQIEVHAKDPSQPHIQNLQKNKGKIKSVQRQTAGYGAILPKRYHWSVSFEPFPAFREPRGLEDVARRSLINIKGMKVFFSEPPKNKEIRTYRKRMKVMAKIYGAKLEEKIVEIEIKGDYKDQTIKHPLVVFNLITNHEARRKALIDLKVERRKYSQTKEQKRSEWIKNTAKNLRISEKEVRESLKRIKFAERSGLKTIAM